MKIAALLLTTLVLLVSPLSAAEPPLGSPDFYPSPDRPVGFKGDGNGYYPGATPVAEWWEGTPERKEREFPDKWGRMKERKYWDIAPSGAKNIVWKTEMPSWANSQPIVVGDRVITMAEPDRVVCVDARSGDILWTRRINPWAAAGVPGDVAEKLQAMHDIYREALPSLRSMTNSSTVDRVVPADEWHQILPPFERKVLPRLLGELERLDPETDWQTPAETMMAELKRHIAALESAEGKKKPEAGKEITALHETIRKRVEQLGGIDVKLRHSWGHMVGSCMTAPVSDGRHVWVSFGHYGQTACLDLDGHLRWARWFEEQNRTPTKSPLLVGDTFVDMHGRSTLRGLDKHTGELIWEAPRRSSEIKKQKGGYDVGSQKIVRLTGDGKAVDVIVTTECNIIRPTDGKVIGHLPWPHDYGPSGGPSVFSSGNIVYRASNGDGGGSPFTAYRLTPAGDDQVRAKIIWQSKRKASPGYASQIATPELAVMTSEYGSVVEAETGKVLLKRGRGSRLGELSNNLGGNILLWAEDGNRDIVRSKWSRRRFDNKWIALFHTRDLSDPASPKVLSDKNVLGDDTWPRMPAMERLAPELYALDVYRGKAYGKVPHGLHTDNAVFLSGNRIFIRTVGHLYCIGDPDEPYNWNPQSRR